MCLLRKHGTYLSCFSQHPCFVSIPMFSSVTSLKHLAVTIGCEEKGEKNACAKKKSTWKRQHATELVCTCMFSFWDLHSFARTLFQMQSALGVQRSTVWQQKQEVSTPVRKASMKMQNTIRLRWPRRLHAARREKLQHWILNTFVGTATAKFGFQAKTRHRNNSPKVLHVPGDWGRSRS